jgi:plastocyanin domain-containing protein
MKTSTAIIIILIIIGAGYFLFRDKLQNNPSNVPLNYDPVSIENVSIVDGKQIIEIRAKGGYQPRKSMAKAGIPTILRFNTSGTFDCSSSVRIPSMNVSKSLPQSGSTDIDIGEGKLGTLQGSCGMGMYPFEIEFKG